MAYNFGQGPAISEVDLYHRVLQGAAQRGGQFYLIFTVLRTFRIKMSVINLESCTPVKRTPWSTVSLQLKTPPIENNYMKKTFQLLSGLLPENPVRAPVRHCLTGSLFTGSFRNWMRKRSPSKCCKLSVSADNVFCGENGQKERSHLDGIRSRMCQHLSSFNCENLPLTNCPLDTAWPWRSYQEEDSTELVFWGSVRAALARWKGLCLKGGSYQLNFIGCTRRGSYSAKGRVSAF